MVLNVGGSALAFVMCLVGDVDARGRGCAARRLALVGAESCCHRAVCWSATGLPDAFGDAGGVWDHGKNHINVESVNTNR